MGVYHFKSCVSIRGLNIRGELTGHGSLFPTVITALPIATPREFVNSASFAFGDFENSTFK